MTDRIWTFIAVHIFKCPLCWMDKYHFPPFVLVSRSTMSAIMRKRTWASHHRLPQSNKTLCTTAVKALLTSCSAVRVNCAKSLVFLLTVSETSPLYPPSGRTGPASVPFRWHRGVCGRAASRCARKRTPWWHCEGPRLFQSTCGGPCGPSPTRICHSASHKTQAEERGD